MSELSLFTEIREASAEVCRRSRYVRIDDEALNKLTALLARERPDSPSLDPAHKDFSDPDTTLAFVLTINAINFGSGWFPQLTKRAGLSGYLTIATALRERFEKEGPWTAGQLTRLTTEDCAAVLGQTVQGAAGKLMALYAEALRDLGTFLRKDYEGRFAGPFEEARGSSEAMVKILARMPFYRDVCTYDGFEVPFYKRAQITVSDLHSALGGKGLGRFGDIDDLTIFADNLVPHTLRMFEVLRYDLRLDLQIEAGETLEWGSESEVEIRAAGLHAVEQIVAGCRERGWKTNAQRVDHLLWSRGQSPAIKARPRHRTRCTFY